MANTSCSFTSINDLLAQAEAGQVNITTVVSTCQGICSITWGDGNPDLSGIGLVICYVFQAVLTVLFGSLFCKFYYHSPSTSTNDTSTTTNSTDKKKKTSRENFEELHDTFLDTIALFSVPVAVATVMRLHHNPPIYEMAFMYSLTTMQFLSLLATAVTAGIFGRRGKYKSPIRIVVICLYGLFDFGFYMGLVGGLRTNAARWEAIDELGDACQAYGTLLPGFKAIRKLRWLLPHVNWSSYFKGLFEFKAKFKIGLIIIGFVLAGIVCLGIVMVMVGLIGYTFKRKNIPMVGLMGLGLSIGMLYELVRMEQTRTLMRDITGSNFTDNQWGFGQVVSLFLWVPTCAQAIYCLFCKSSRLMSLSIRMASDLLSRIGTLSIRTVDDDDHPTLPTRISS